MVDLAAVLNRFHLASSVEQRQDAVSEFLSVNGRFE